MSQENSSISLNDKLSEKLNELNQLNKEESEQFKTNELVEDSNEIVEESNELVEESNELVEESNELVEESNELVEETNELADSILNIEINKEIELFYFYNLERKYVIYNKEGEILISSQAKLSFKNTIINGKKVNCLNFDNKVNLKVLINNNKVTGFGFGKKMSLLSQYFESKVTNLNIGKIVIL